MAARARRKSKVAQSSPNLLASQSWRQHNLYFRHLAGQPHFDRTNRNSPRNAWGLLVTWRPAR